MSQNKMNHILIFSLLCGTGVLYAQQDAKELYDGNDFYHSGKVPESSAKYAKALELNPNNKKANFNLGTALYKNALLIKSGALNMPNTNITPDSLSKLVLDQAAQNFAVVANSVSDKDTLHQSWHNIGNCYLQKKDYQQAVDAYKKALKYNPKDEDTRYNLAYALKNLPKDKKGGGGKQNQPQNKKDEDKNDKNKNSSPQQNQMNKEQAEQLLKALMNNEKKLQDKRKQKQSADQSKLDKDW